MKTNADKATPRPWYRVDNYIQSSKVNEDNFVCECDTTQDAELVVHAVNNHERLLEALKSAKCLLSRIEPEGMEADEVAIEIEDAIKQAEGGVS